MGGELLLDYHIVLFPYMIEKFNLDINKDRNKTTDDIVSFFTSTFAHISGATNLEAIKFTETLQRRLETEMKKIISTKSIYYWFHIYRRIAPVETFDGESKQTVWLYRNILENAFLKYGKKTTDNELISSTDKRLVKVQDIASGLYVEALKYYKLYKIIDKKFNGIFLGNFAKEELLEIFILERLAFEFWRTTVCLRRIYKGGVLIIEKYQYWVDNDSDTEFLMKSYDSRNSSLSDVSCSDGINIFTTEISNGTMFVPKYNVEQLSLLDYPEHLIFKLNIHPKMLQDFKPNFLWIPVNFDYYYKSHEFYMKAFQKQFGYKMESFVYTLYLILFRELKLCGESQSAGIENLKRAYRHVRSCDELADELIEYYETGKAYGLYTYKLTREEVIMVLEDLMLPEETSGISLVTLGPRYVLFPAINGDYIIDYAAISPVLMTKMHFLTVKRENKGHLFEDVVIERLKEKEFFLWECKKKLEHNDSTSKEIDISFIYKDFLFVGELKSNKMSLSYIKGDSKSLRFRKAKMIDALSQVDEKAKWLSLHTTGTNYCIPKDIKAIIPFVVTPFDEYIWSRSKSLWITDSIPRICTPSECELLCSDEIIKELACKPYIVYLV